MSQFITHNSKRYEVVDDAPFIGCKMLTELDHIVEARSLGHIEILVNHGAKMLIEIPLYTEHTLSSVLLHVDKLLQDKERRKAFNKIRFADLVNKNIFNQ